jgi:Bifunctional DNA primase/polymerase, N-terminal/Primase C terminal 1 (PriCT-1)
LLRSGAKQPGNEEAFLQAALGYRRRGWSPLPLRPREKIPILAWEALQHEAASTAEIEGWFARWPDANVGIVTGRVSDLVVLDIDPRHGGEESLRLWEASRGPIPMTVEALTGGGGRHLYFAGGREPPRNRAGLAPGIDLRGEGGMVVAPPSIHPSGRAYRWIEGRAPADLALAPLPAWIARLARGAGQRTGHPLSYWRELVRADIEQGRRNDTLARFAGHLLWHGVDPDVALELLLAWNQLRCKPPLDDSEVASVVHSISRLHIRATERD